MSFSGCWGSFETFTKCALASAHLPRSRVELRNHAGRFDDRLRIERGCTLQLPLESRRGGVSGLYQANQRSEKPTFVRAVGIQARPTPQPFVCKDQNFLGPLTNGSTGKCRAKPQAHQFGPVFGYFVVGQGMCESSRTLQRRVIVANCRPKGGHCQ